MTFLGGSQPVKETAATFDAGCKAVTWAITEAADIHYAVFGPDLRLASY